MENLLLFSYGINLLRPQKATLQTDCLNTSHAENRSILDAVIQRMSNLLENYNHKHKMTVLNVLINCLHVYNYFKANSSNRDFL